MRPSFMISDGGAGIPIDVCKRLSRSPLRPARDLANPASRRCRPRPIESPTYAWVPAMASVAGSLFLSALCYVAERHRASTVSGPTGAGEAPPSAWRRPDRVGAGGSAELSSRASSLKTMLKTEITQQIYSY